MSARFWTIQRKKDALAHADSSGQVADSMEVRTRLIEQMNRGEKTLAEVQAELAAIKKSAKKNGLKTRTQIWNQA